MNQSATRKATESELSEIKRLLANSPTKFGRLKQAAENALVLWALVSLIIFALWQGIAWLSLKLLDVNLRDATIWVALVGEPIIAVYSIVSSIRWISMQRNMRPLFKVDFEQGEVIEEHFHFVEAKRFQELEHDGLIYFFRTPDDKVFCVFDYESQDLGVMDKDAMLSAFRPKSELTVVRAPKSGRTITQSFGGNELSVGVPSELTAEPDVWPEFDSYCDIPWSELETRLSRPVKAKKQRV